MKRNYCKPVLMEETFLSNDYITVCGFFVACKCNQNLNAPVPYVGWYTTQGYNYGLWNSKYKECTIDKNHSGNCLQAQNNHVDISSDGSSITGVWESAGWNSHLNGIVQSWSDQDHDGKPSQGDVFLWSTYQTSPGENQGKQWNHWGYLQKANRS